MLPQKQATDRLIFMCIIKKKNYLAYETLAIKVI